MLPSNLLTPTEQRPGFFRSVSSTSQLTTRSDKSAKALAIARAFSYQKDKARLYLALLPRGGVVGGTYGTKFSCGHYHWVIVIGPKSPLRTEAGTAYHLVHSSSELGGSSSILYEETDLNETPHLTRNILARISLAKIIDEQHVVRILRSLANIARDRPRTSHPVTSHSGIDINDLSCLSWVRSAWEALASDPSRPLKSYLGPEDWDDIENRARKYVKRKRTQGRYSYNTQGRDATWNPVEIPTWNYWENRETTD